MITSFTTYIAESDEFEKSTDYLETLTPDDLGKLLRSEVQVDYPDIQYIRDLLDVGCPIDAGSQYGHTALHYAAMYGDREVVKLLVSNGANIEVRDDWDKTPLHYTTSDGQLGLVEFLISKGVDVNARDADGRTPLHWAALDGYIKVVELLVSNGADIHVRTNDGRTAWGCANPAIRKACPKLNPNA